MPSRPDIAWNRNQLKKLRSAVSVYNRTITNLEKKYGDTVELPNRTTVAKERERLHTSYDLNKRVAQLRRITKKENPKAQEIVDGKLNYLNQEAKRELRAGKRQQEKRRDVISQGKYEKDFNELNAQQKANVLSAGNLDTYNYDENALSADDYDELIAMKYSINDHAYSKQYRDSLIEWWSDDTAVPRIIKIMDELKRIPGALMEIFDRGDQETQIYYIYPSSEGLESFPDRRAYVIDYWEEQAKRYGIE